jgi:SET domain-containing protein
MKLRATNNITNSQSKYIHNKSEFSMLHKNIAVGQSQIGGAGLFATRLIRSGERIWWENDLSHKLVDWSDIMKMPPREREEFIEHAWQFDETRWVADDPKSDTSLLMNHSCDPNAWFVSDTLMTARRDISPGEEVTYDYATSEAFSLFIECRCGSANCRGFVTHDDHLLEAFQAAYRGHVMSHIERKWRETKTLEKSRLKPVLRTV